MTDRTKVLEAELEAVQARQDTQAVERGLEKPKRQHDLKEEQEEKGKCAKLEAELASRVLKVMAFA